MIRKKIIGPIRKKINKKIENVIVELDSKKVKPKPSHNTILYFPYNADEPSYLIAEKKPELNLCSQKLPIPPKDLWLGYGNNESEYLCGKIQVDLMMHLLSKSGFSFKKKDRIYDFGCGAGRMIRWLKPISDICEIWGSDINANHISWSKEFLQPPFNFFTSTVVPHLPFEDNYFDLIYSCSVFTHIEDITEAWLLELRRILSPNGRLYITINDNNTISELEKNPIYETQWLKSVISENGVFINNKDNFDLFVTGRGSDSKVFYNINYFKKMVGTMFEILSITNSAYGFETGILMQKK